MNDLNIEFSSLNAKNFIISDSSANPNHSSFSMRNSKMAYLKGNFIMASKSSVLDSVIVSDCQFHHMSGTVLNFNVERDKMGYYNVEKLKVFNTIFSNNSGQILSIIRSGKDESTMGPWLLLIDNKLSNCQTLTDDPLFYISGINRSFTDKNNFKECNRNKKLFLFEDTVKASHLFLNNKMVDSGDVVIDQYVKSENNYN
jgi:hypothetical protein